MNRSQKTSDFRQGELFAAHDVTWWMLSEDQQMQAIGLLSQLLLASLGTQPQSHDQACHQQIETSENRP